MPGQSVGKPRPGAGSEPDSPVFTRVFYTNFSGGNAASGCAPSAITLFLTIMVWISYGFLAALGFVFFVVIGRVLTLALSMRRILAGRPINPWLLHLAVWVICWFMAAWLSGGSKVISL